MADKKPKFTFQQCPGKKFATLEDKDNKELLTKWSMCGNLLAQMYTFDQPFQVYQKDEFMLKNGHQSLYNGSLSILPFIIFRCLSNCCLHIIELMAEILNVHPQEKDFMRDPAVMSSLLVASKDGNPRLLNMPAESIKVEVVPCSILSMAFFDRLYGSVVRDTGYLHKCFDEFVEDFTISDELRKMLLSEESDHVDLYSDSEKNEFLFRLFRHVCLGGQICQYEDKIDPYLNFTKSLYKDLVSVQKNAETKDLNITSSVFKIQAMDKDGEVFYPSSKRHEQTFSYLIVDPLKRHVIVLYHQFGGGVFS
ncbi:cilia- and flagella-associated protein 300-like isoform X1 [Dreissena polymorpha]|uniref:cilia- and flagella-associated protein 300-like isoform X1 n=1 Tax=Dreissena polymorpha TaxID=45954 RepID=UPI0022642880|nr:cilia- and flagella-associated protein 300-like isoform X1 [Dreissena polymorpha]